MKALAAVAALCLAAFPAFAQAPATVEYSLDASMKSLRDAQLLDAFIVEIKDAQASINFDMTCQGGRKSWVVFTVNEECGVGGKGLVLNTATNDWIPRAIYSGGFTVGKNGYAGGDKLLVSYNPIGSSRPPATAFSGNMVMKPEIPSSLGAQIRDMAMARYQQTTGTGSSVIDDRIDTVDFERLLVPSIGLPSDPGCTWGGSHVYSYQTESWLIQLNANCGGQEYKFTGNMTWTDIDDQQAQYNLNLVLETAATTTMTDADLFVAQSDSDLFAAASGISATINIQQSGWVTVQVDGADEELASQIEATGTFTGTGVPLATVRSYTVLFGILSRTFFGA